MPTTVLANASSISFGFTAVGSNNAFRITSGNSSPSLAYDVSVIASFRVLRGASSSIQYVTLT